KGCEPMPASRSRSAGVQTAGSVRAVPERIDGAAVGTGILAPPGPVWDRETTAIAGGRGSGEAGRPNRSRFPASIAHAHSQRGGRTRFPASPLPRRLTQADTL